MTGKRLLCTPESTSRGEYLSVAAVYAIQVEKGCSAHTQGGER